MTEPRRRQRRKAARPAEIIDAGLAEFGARGFAATRMEDVARRAGVAKGTVFLYFPSKEALFEAALLSRLVPVFDGLDAMLDDWPGPSAELLGLLLRRLHGLIAGSDATVLIRVIVAEGHRFPHLLAAYHRETVSRGQAVLGRIVARGVERGEFHAGAVAALPMVLVAPALMAALWRLTFEAIDPVPAERFLAAHLELVLRALAAR